MMCKSHRLLLFVTLSLVATCFIVRSRAQSNDKLKFTNLPDKLQALLIKRLNEFVESDRTRQYERQYEMYMPKFAKRFFIAKDKDDYARIFRAEGDSRERMTAFQPTTFVMTKDSNLGDFCLIYGVRTNEKGNETYQSHVSTRAVLRNGKWYFADFWHLVPE